MAIFTFCFWLVKWDKSVYFVQRTRTAFPKQIEVQLPYDHYLTPLNNQKWVRWADTLSEAEGCESAHPKMLLWGCASTPRPKQQDVCSTLNKGNLIDSLEKGHTKACVARFKMKCRINKTFCVSLSWCTHIVEVHFFTNATNFRCLGWQFLKLGVFLNVFLGADENSRKRQKCF